MSCAVFASTMALAVGLAVLSGCAQTNAGLPGDPARDASHQTGDRDASASSGDAGATAPEAGTDAGTRTVEDARGEDGGSEASDASSADAGAEASAGSLYNGIQWADSAGNPIQAHGGGVLEVGDFYYWFGENRNPNGTFFAVSCYRSRDLVHWEFRRHVLSQDSAAELQPANIERPKVIYNATTRKYVMWMHWENGRDYGASRAAVAVSDSVDGDYTYLGSARPLLNSGVIDHGTAGYQSRDCTLFVDTDGKAYFLSASNENYDLNLYLLKSDYLSIDSLAAVLFKGGHREAPALWKRNNVYFLFTSGATGWNPNQAQYASSSSLTSGWSGWTNVGDGTTFHSQSTFVLPLENGFLYMGDRWAGAWSGPVNDSTYIWLPLGFPSNTAISMSWSNTLTLEAGKLTGSNHGFKLLNKQSGKAMSVTDAADGSAVVQTTYTGGEAQQWSLDYDGAGYFNLTNTQSGRVADVSSRSTADGAPLIQYTDNDGDNQKWRIVDKGAGDYQLINKLSSKLAEAPSSAEGAPLNQRAAAANAEDQLWQLSPAD